MFDQMKALGAIAGLMKNKERLAELKAQFEDRLGRVRIVGQSGGGAVRVTVTGKMRVEEVAIDPSVASGAAADDSGRALAEGLVAEAVNDAMDKAQALMREEAQRIARELDLPDLPGMDKMLGAP